MRNLLKPTFSHPGNFDEELCVVTINVTKPFNVITAHDVIIWPI